MFVLGLQCQKFINVFVLLKIMQDTVLIELLNFVMSGATVQIMVTYSAVIMAGAGGYSYLLEPLWWAGMVTSGFFFFVCLKISSTL